MDIIKISMLGVCGVMLGFILKGTRPEYASFITMAIGILILGLAAGKVAYLFETLDRLRQRIPVDGSYLATLVKIIGITYIGQFSAGICKDAGFSAIGSQIEMFAKFSIMAVSVPVLLTLLETIEGLLSTWK